MGGSIQNAADKSLSTLQTVYNNGMAALEKLGPKFQTAVQAEVKNAFTPENLRKQASQSYKELQALKAEDPELYYSIMGTEGLQGAALSTAYEQAKAEFAEWTGNTTVRKELYNYQRDLQSELVAQAKKANSLTDYEILYKGDLEKARAAQMTAQAIYSKAQADALKAQIEGLDTENLSPEEQQFMMLLSHLGTFQAIAVNENAPADLRTLATKATTDLFTRLTGDNISTELIKKARGLKLITSVGTGESNRVDPVVSKDYLTLIGGQ